MLGPGDSGDIAVAKVDEVLSGKLRPASVVDDDRIDVFET